MNPNVETERRDWQTFHEKAFFIDMHAHPTFPASFFPPRPFFPFVPSYRHANQCDLDHLPDPRAYRGSTIFKFRTAFPLLQAGGADVVLTYTVVPELDFLTAILGTRINLRRIVRFPLFLPLGKKYVWPSYFDSALNMMEAIKTEVGAYNRFAEEANRTAAKKHRFMEIVRSVERLKELKAMNGAGPIALVHSIEGAHSLQGDIAGKKLKKFQRYHLTGQIESEDAVKQEVLANLRCLCERGAARLTIAHFYPNVVAAPCFPYPDYALRELDILGNSEEEEKHHNLALGLTPIGMEVIREAFKLGMLIDVTHSTPRARASVYAIADEMDVDYQVVATHIGAYAVNPSPYNLEDWEIEWIANRKGIVGVILMPFWTQPQSRVMGVDFLSRTIEHIRKVGGDNVIAIGTDLDGATDPPNELAHYGQMPRLTERLMAEYFHKQDKYSDALIEKILGGNAWSVLVNGWRGHCDVQEEEPSSD